MSISNEIRQAVIDAIISAGTLAERNVFGPRDWPTKSDILPAVFVQAPSARYESWGRNGYPKFTVTVNAMVTARIEAPDAQTAQDLIEALARQLKNGVLTYAPLVDCLVQQFASIDEAIRVTSEGAKHVGECELTFAIESIEEYPQENGPQRLDPDSGAPEPPTAVSLQTVTVTINQGQTGQPQPYLEFDNLQS